MSRPVTVPSFEDEELFRAWYLQLKNPQEHLLALREWRVRQSKMVGSLGHIIGHFGGEQYTEVDHFLLELLQNADDNTYEHGVTPTLSITLESNQIVFNCNEVGFSAENVFSICYAAASTKRRKPGKRSYIGEKGIGFKSLFAVAEAVEIHSGGYHFELRDKEFIVPHLLSGQIESGSKIVVRFKPTMNAISQLLSHRLTILARNADHFVLFLQKLEKFIIADKLTATATTVGILREENLCIVQQGNAVPRSYRMVSETIEFPETIVRDRFEHLDGSLARDVRFAVPYPNELDGKSHNGLLFCFLPTRVMSGFPFHIQLDGKTTTNRENIESGARSKWNAHLVSQLPTAIKSLFLKLRDDPAFSGELPRYLPASNLQEIGNDDLKLMLNQLVGSLGHEPLALDRKKVFRPINALFSAPKSLAEWVETDQFAIHLGPEHEFLHPDWRKHESILALFGCTTLAADKLAELFINGGCPHPVVNAADEKLVRDFLEKWIALRSVDAWARVKLKAAPIYPLKDGQTHSFGPITDKTLLVSLDGREVPVPVGSVILDPFYTYSPGGNVDEGIRGFNERFRTYLTGVLKMERYSDAKYLEEVLIPNLHLECAKPVLDEADHIMHTERWLELFNRVWWRQKTIIGDSSQDRLQKMLLRIGECNIVTGAKQESGWPLTPLREALLPRSWWQDQVLAAAYEKAGAPLISLALEKVYPENVSRSPSGDSKLNLQEWTQFLLACGAAEGPRLIRTSLPTGNDFPKSATDLNAKCSACWTNGKTPSIRTTDFDTFTCRLLALPEQIENLTTAIARLWPELRLQTTDLEWSYRGVKVQQIDGSIARCRVNSSLPVASDCGPVLPFTAVFNTEHNRVVGSGLVPLVEISRYGSEEFLLHLGVSERINEAWLEARADMATQVIEDEAFIKMSSLVMRIAARLAKFRPEGRTWIRTARIFAHRETRDLLTYDAWIEQKGDVGFSHVVTNEVFDALDAVSQTSAASLVGELFEMGDLLDHNSRVVDWLRSIGNNIRLGRSEEIALAFANRLRERGLVFYGHLVNGLENLPLIWDGFPNPNSAIGLIILPEDQSDRDLCVAAGKVVGWPRLSARTMQIQCASCERIDDLTFKQLQLTTEFLESKFSKVPGHRPAKSFLIRLLREGRLAVFLASDIALTISDWAETPEVDFWFSKADGKLFVDEKKVSLSEVLGRMIDFQAATTVSPFIDAIFEQQETPAKHAIARLRAPLAKPIPPVHPIQPTPNPADDAGSSAGEPITSPTSTVVRRRLFSYVSLKGDSKNRTKRDGASGSNDNSAVELAGEKLLIDFCAKHGLGCIDVTAEDLGYDFKIQAINGEFMVELKSTPHQWQRWENSLSPNEFKSAIQHADNYVLCVAEEVLSQNGSLIFIQNPWGLADGFLFDSPWKKAATDPVQLFSIHEEASGAPPPRDEEP